MRYVFVILLMFTSLGLCAQQDEYFDDFCLAFEKFEASWSNYREAGAKEKVHAALINMTQQYHTMLRVYDEVSFKYRHSTAFDTISRPYYLLAMDETEVLLEVDLTLRSVKQMVQTMVTLERGGFPKHYDDINKALGRLHFLDYYSDGAFNRTIEGYLVQKQIRSLEAYMFRRYFEPVLEKIDSSGRTQIAAFKVLTENTHCTPCREKAVPALLKVYKH